MPTHVSILRCLLISPGDVQMERQGVGRALDRWNLSIGSKKKCHIQGIHWEVHARPQLGAPPQTILNRQLVDQCQMGIAIFGARLGTPTERYPSGSVEEIERLRSQNKPVYLYFSERPIEPSAVELNQLVRLRAVKEEYFKQGVVGRYTSVADLENQVGHHLTGFAEEVLNRRRN